MTPYEICSEIYRLGYYEEVVGLLEHLEEMDGSLIAKIGKVRIILPLSFEPRLRPLIGQRTAILRTDLPEKPYLYRVIAQEGEPAKQ